MLLLSVVVSRAHVARAREPSTLTAGATSDPFVNIDWSLNLGWGPNSDVFASDRSRLDYHSLVLDGTVGRRWRWVHLGADLQVALTRGGAESFFAGAFVGPQVSWRRFAFGAEAAIGGRNILGWRGLVSDPEDEWFWSSQLAGHVTTRVGDIHVGIWAALRQDLTFHTAILKVSDPFSADPTAAIGEVGAHLGGYSTFLGLRLER